MRLERKLLSVWVVGLLFVAACGGDGGGDRTVEPDVVVDTDADSDQSCTTECYDDDLLSYDTQMPDVADASSETWSPDTHDTSGPDTTTCTASEHLCDGVCVANDAPETCGDACSPCPDAPANAHATCDAGTCGVACDAGFQDCHGACIADSASCGEPLASVSCTTSSDCGNVGACLDALCVCAAGTRPCAAGCCADTMATTELAGVAGERVQLEYGPDGTAYILVQTEVGTSPNTSWELHLYTRAPGAATIERASLTIPTSHDREVSDFAIRSDGVLFAAVASVYAEGTPVDLWEWSPGTAATSENMGSAFGYEAGVGMTIDGDDTVWASWRTGRSGGMSAYSLASDGVRRSYTHSNTSEQTDVEWNPATDGVYSFWGSRGSGTFLSGVVILDEGPALTATCPADDAAFDSAGRVWSAYNSYSSIHTSFCLDGDEVEARSATIRGSLPTAFSPSLAIDSEDVAYMGFYEDTAYTAHWLASTDNVTWSRGVIPTNYGLPSGSTNPGRAAVSAARRPDGRISFVVVPNYASMGSMVLADF